MFTVACHVKSKNILSFWKNDKVFPFTAQPKDKNNEHPGIDILKCKAAL